MVNTHGASSILAAGQTAATGAELLSKSQIWARFTSAQKIKLLPAMTKARTLINTPDDPIWSGDSASDVAWQNLAVFTSDYDLMGSTDTMIWPNDDAAAFALTCSTPSPGPAVPMTSAQQTAFLA